MGLSRLAGVALALALAACAAKPSAPAVRDAAPGPVRPPPPPPADAAPPLAPECVEAIDLFTRRDLAAWRGWPAACSVHALLDEISSSLLPLDDAPLGESRTPTPAFRVTAMLPARGGGSKQLLELLVYWRGERLVRVDLDDEPLVGGSVADLLAALGAPAARLPYQRWGYVHAHGQWVWPARGLAVYVDASDRRIVHAAIFSPTDLATYQRELSWP